MDMPLTLDNIRLFGLFGLKFFGFAEGADGTVDITVGPSVTGPLLLLFVACGVLGYLLGTLNFAIIISKFKYREDVRDYGSGNAGMTNMMRTYGRAAGIFTFLGDLLKAVIAVMIGWLALGEAGAHFAGFCCILGHAFPVWYGFRGGKGVAVTAAMILCVEPLLFVFLLIIFAVVLAFTRYLSLASMMSILMYPVLLNNLYRFLHQPSPFFFVVTICSVLTAVLVLILHRGNMRRLLDHTEPKFSLKKHGEKTEKK